MKRPRLIVGAILLAAVVAFVVWNVREPSRTFMLSDGTKVTLRGVTVGTNTTFYFGNPFQRILARMPGKMGAKFKSRISATSESDQNCATFWFSYNRPTKNPHYMGVRLIHDTLEQFPPPWWRPPKALPNGEMIAACGHEIWPRRDKTFTLQVLEEYQGGSWKRLGETRIRNPEPQKYPDWKPESLPASRRCGDVEFLLEEVDPSMGFKELKGLISGGWAAPVEVRMRARRNGQPDTDWEVWAYQVWDAMNNRYPDPSAAWFGSLQRAKANEQGELRFPARCYIWPSEEAFKLGLEMICAGRWSSNELFTIRGVPTRLKPKGQYWKWTTNTAGHSIKFWLGPDEEGGEKQTLEHCLRIHEPQEIELSVDRREASRFLIVSANDDQKRPLNVIERRKIYIPADCKSLDLTLVPSRREFIEYTLDRKLLPVSSDQARSKLK